MTPAVAIGLALAAGAVWYFASLFHGGVRGNGDGRFYLEAGMGKPVPRVYAIRWLMPAVLGGNAVAWQFATAAHLIALPAGVAIYGTALGLEPWRALVSGLLTLGLTGIWNVNVEMPVLVDAPALLWSALAAAALVSDWTVTGVALAILAATLKEQSPVFIAAAAVSPWALLALLAPLAAWLLKPDVSRPDWANWLETKPGIFLNVGKRRLLDPKTQFAPWGPALLVALAAPTLALGLSLAAGYAVGLGGYVGSRYYHWAWLPVVAGAAAVVPEWGAGGLVALQLFNPWRGNGL